MLTFKHEKRTAGINCNRQSKPKFAQMLASGEFNHYESGENRQF